MPEETQDKELQALNSKTQLNDGVKSFRNLSEAEQSELLGLLAQSRELNCGEIESKMGELSEYWGKILIEILKKNRLNKEEENRKIRVNEQIKEIHALENLTYRVSVESGKMKLGGVSGLILKLKWGENKDLKSDYSTYYYIWSLPVSVRELKRYFDTNKIKKEVEKYIITEDEICQLLYGINEYMKVNGVENDGDIDYKVRLQEGKTKILAGKYLIRVVPEFRRGVITKDGDCLIYDPAHGEFEFSQVGYKSCNVILKIPNEMMMSEPVRDAMLNHKSIELF